MGKCNSFDTGPGSGKGRLAEIQIAAKVIELVDNNLDISSGLEEPFIVNGRIVDMKKAVSFLSRVSEIGILLKESHPHTLLRISASREQIADIRFTADLIVQDLAYDLDEMREEFPGYENFIDNYEKYVE